MQYVCVPQCSLRAIAIEIPTSLAALGVAANLALKITN